MFPAPVEIVEDRERRYEGIILTIQVCGVV